MRSHVSRTSFVNKQPFSSSVRSHRCCIHLLILSVSMMVLFRIFVSDVYMKTSNTVWRRDMEPQQRYACDRVGGIADYLVTGGAGFIGSALVKSIRKKEPSAVIKVVDNLWRGTLENLRVPGGFVIDLARHFHNVDLTEVEPASEVIGCARTVYHLADIVAGIDYVFANQAFVFRQNMLINSNTLAAASHALSHVENYIYVGTACSFPKHLQMTYTPTALSENQTYPASPESSYGWSKLMGEYEATLQQKRPDNRLNISVLRFHNVFGPGMVWGAGAQAIPALIFKAINVEEVSKSAAILDVFGSGKQYRDFVFIDDIVQALLLAPSAYGKGVVQIGTGRPVRVDEVAHMIARMIAHAFHKKISPRFSPQGLEGDRGRVAVRDRAEKILKWRPHTVFEEGLALTFTSVAEGMLRQHGALPSLSFPPASTHMLSRLRDWTERIQANMSQELTGLSDAAFTSENREHKTNSRMHETKKFVRLPPTNLSISTTKQHSKLSSHEIRQTSPPRVLVIVVGQPRGGEYAYQSMEKYLLRPHRAHLATFFTSASPATYLQKIARYNWIVPEYHDWFAVLDSVFATCMSSTSVKEQRALLWGQGQGGTKFMGRHDNVQHSTSSVILLAFRWLVQQKMLQLDLMDQYDAFVFTRADEVHLCEHANIGQMLKECPNCTWFQEGEDYGGISDRHFIASTKAFFRALNVTNSVLCESQLYFDRVGNLEMLIKRYMTEQKLPVRLFPPSFFSVKRQRDSTRWSHGVETPESQAFGLRIKYMGEYERACKQCGESMSTTLPKLALVNTSAP